MNGESIAALSSLCFLFYISDAIQATDYTANAAYTAAGNAQRDAMVARSVAYDIKDYLTLPPSGSYHFIMRTNNDGSYPEWVPNNSEGVWPFTAFDSAAAAQTEDGAYHVFYISNTEWEGISDSFKTPNCIFIIYDDAYVYAPKYIYIGFTKVYGEPDYFYIKGQDHGQYIRFNCTTGNYNLEYKVPGFDAWCRYTFSAGGAGLALWLEPEKKIYFRGLNPNGFNGNVRFNSETRVRAGGNIMTLLDPTGNRIDVPPYGFKQLFIGSFLTRAPELPAKFVNISGYESMFEASPYLDEPPRLPATYIVNGAYSNMFKNCQLLSVLPNLPSTYLTTGCYSEMFAECREIRLSTTKTGDYQYPYAIPDVPSFIPIDTESGWNYNMFSQTGGTFKGNPVAGTTYYTTSKPV